MGDSEYPSYFYHPVPYDLEDLDSRILKVIKIIRDQRLIISNIIISHSSAFTGYPGCEDITARIIDTFRNNFGIETIVIDMRKIEPNEVLGRTKSKLSGADTGEENTPTTYNTAQDESFSPADGKNDAYPLPVPQADQQEALDTLGAGDSIRFNTELTDIRYLIPSKAQEARDFWQENRGWIAQGLEQLTQITRRGPPEGITWIITTDPAKLGIDLLTGMPYVAACDIASKTVYIHPYFFSLPEAKQIEILYHELISHIANNEPNEEKAMRDTQTFVATIASRDKGGLGISKPGRSWLKRLLKSPIFVVILSATAIILALSPILLSGVFASPAILIYQNAPLLPVTLRAIGYKWLPMLNWRSIFTFVPFGILYPLIAKPIKTKIKQPTKPWKTIYAEVLKEIWRERKLWLALGFFQQGLALPLAFAAMTYVSPFVVAAFIASSTVFGLLINLFMRLVNYRSLKKSGKVFFKSILDMPKATTRALVLQGVGAAIASLGLIIAFKNFKLDWVAVIFLVLCDITFAIGTLYGRIYAVNLGKENTFEEVSKALEEKGINFEQVYVRNVTENHWWAWLLYKPLKVRINEHWQIVEQNADGAQPLLKAGIQPKDLISLSSVESLVTRHIGLDEAKRNLEVLAKTCADDRDPRLNALGQVVEQKQTQVAKVKKSLTRSYDGLIAVGLACGVGIVVFGIVAYFAPHIAVLPMFSKMDVLGKNMFSGITLATTWTLIKPVLNIGVVSAISMAYYYVFYQGPKYVKNSNHQLISIATFPIMVALWLSLFGKFKFTPLPLIGSAIIILGMIFYGYSQKIWQKIKAKKSPSSGTPGSGGTGKIAEPILSKWFEQSVPQAPVTFDALFAQAQEKIHELAAKLIRSTISGPQLGLKNWEWISKEFAVQELAELREILAALARKAITLREKEILAQLEIPDYLMEEMRTLRIECSSRSRKIIEEEVRGLLSLSKHGRGEQRQRAEERLTRMLRMYPTVVGRMILSDYGQQISQNIMVKKSTYPGSAGSARRRGTETPLTPEDREKINNVISKIEFHEFAEVKAEFITQFTQALDRIGEGAAARFLEYLASSGYVRAPPLELLKSNAGLADIFKKYFGLVYFDNYGEEWIILAPDILQVNHPELIPTGVHEGVEAHYTQHYFSRDQRKDRVLALKEASVKAHQRALQAEDAIKRLSTDACAETAGKKGSPYYAFTHMPYRAYINMPQGKFTFTLRDYLRGIHYAVSSSTARRDFNTLEQLGLVKIHRCSSGGKPSEIKIQRIAPLGPLSALIDALRFYRSRRDFSKTQALIAIIRTNSTILELYNSLYRSKANEIDHAQRALRLALRLKSQYPGFARILLECASRICAGVEYLAEYGDCKKVDGEMLLTASSLHKEISDAHKGIPKQPAVSERPEPRVIKRLLSRKAQAKQIPAEKSIIYKRIFSSRFVKYYLALRAMVNPRARKFVVAYGGAGADISGLWLSTNFTKAYFINERRMSVDRLRCYQQSHEPIQRDDEYYRNKWWKGWAAGDSDLAIEFYVMQELRAMGAAKESIKIQEQGSGDQTRVRLTFKLPGDKRHREIIFVYAHLPAIPAYLQKELEGKLDAYFQKAAKELPKHYSKYLTAVIKWLKPDGFLMLDEYRDCPDCDRRTDISAIIRHHGFKPQSSKDEERLAKKIVAYKTSRVFRKEFPYATTLFYGWKMFVYQHPVPARSRSIVRDASKGRVANSRISLGSKGPDHGRVKVTINILRPTDNIISVEGERPGLNAGDAPSFLRKNLNIVQAWLSEIINVKLALLEGEGSVKKFIGDKSEITLEFCNDYSEVGKVVDGKIFLNWGITNITSTFPAVLAQIVLLEEILHYLFPEDNVHGWVDEYIVFSLDRIGRDLALAIRQIDQLHLSINFEDAFKNRIMQALKSYAKGEFDTEATEEFKDFNDMPEEVKEMIRWGMLLGRKVGVEQLLRASLKHNCLVAAIAAATGESLNNIIEMLVSGKARLRFNSLSFKQGEVYPLLKGQAIKP